MKKIIKKFTAAAAVLSAVFLSMAVLADGSIPDSLTTVENEITVHGIYSANLPAQAVPAASPGSTAEINTPVEVNFSMFGLFPVKTVSVTKTERSYVIPGGNIVGIRMQANGVMIVAIQSFESENGQASPASDAGLLKGDIIC